MPWCGSGCTYSTPYSKLRSSVQNDVDCSWIKEYRFFRLRYVRTYKNILKEQGWDTLEASKFSPLDNFQQILSTYGGWFSIHYFIFIFISNFVTRLEHCKAQIHTLSIYKGVIHIKRILDQIDQPRFLMQSKREKNLPLVFVRSGIV